ncbi:glycosyl transferase, group 1 family protein [Listeria floridensis FSL S10-1187]|uniref:Glycosyl transferase, group 1 family protein n=1 Tax=Listeria floridensis FSL S10-1187 TaxID=1265817 RepID=A0ABP3B0C7_9LIST|nr:glycosyltransferase [Listeria floridensis]EUJ32902.1 glycosyl transferase, group 1 family protein [Listeria floridensis FSL S10-1187]
MKKKPLAEKSINGAPVKDIYLKRGPLDHLAGSEKKYDRIAKEISAETPDMKRVICHWGANLPIAARLKMKRPELKYVQIFHGSDIYVMTKNNETYRSDILHGIELADEIICVSQDLKKAVQKLAPNAENIRVFSNGITAKNFHFDPAEKKKKRIAFVGNLIDIKRAYLLPDIIKKVISKNPDFEFIIMGDGKLRGEIAANLEGIPQAKLLGRVSPEQVSSELGKSDILLLPSKSEGFPCVVNEAKVSGAYVIGTKLPGIIEANLSDDGLVDNDTDEAISSSIAEKILAFPNQPINYEKLVQEAKNFDWQIISKEELAAINAE